MLLRLEGLRLELPTEMFQALQADLIHQEIKEELKDASFFFLFEVIAPPTSPKKTKKQQTAHL